MGVDTRIFIKTNGKWPEDVSLQSWVTIEPVEGYHPEGATHEVHTCERFYGPCYERGDWPIIAATLMDLMASKAVETVWYMGDHEDAEMAKPLTREKFFSICWYYLEHKNRPYYQRRFRLNPHRRSLTARPGVDTGAGK